MPPLVGRDYRISFTNNEFNKYKLNSFKTHNLTDLLHLSGIENNILTNFELDWKEVIANWDPEHRYRKIGSVTDTEARKIIDAVKTLINIRGEQGHRIRLVGTIKLA